jgi:hypothetical protein
LCKEIDETLKILECNRDKTDWAQPIIEYLHTIKNEPFNNYLSTVGEMEKLINRLSQFNFKVRGYFLRLSCPGFSSNTREKYVRLLDKECGELHSDL